MNPHPKSFSAKPAEAHSARAWWVIDAEGKPLGRLASRIATVLRGKHKASFTPHVDTGDFVIVVNADKVLLTGRKMEQKNYYRHSGEPGGFRVVPYNEVFESKPTLPVTKAVKGMLPKNSLGRQMLSKLKVYAGPEHPHQAQKPVPYEITQISQQAGTAKAGK